jgi:signal transduction histidine kinase
MTCRFRHPVGERFFLLDGATPVITKSRWLRFTDWVLARFARRPPGKRVQAWTIIIALVLVIGAVDYASGIRVSLAIFYIVPAMLAVAWLGGRVAVAVACGSVVVRVVGDWIDIGERMLPLWSWWNSLAVLAILLILIWIFDAFLSLYRQLELRVAELVEADAEHRRLEQDLVFIGARERNAFGQELHDDICQHLVGTALAAKVLARRLGERDHAFAAEAQAIVGWVEEGAHKARQLARGLLLSSIDPEMLEEELVALAEEGSASGIPCSFRQEGDTLLPDAGTAAQFFRVAQEAVRNAIKHAAPSYVNISLSGDRNAICLVVEDDGGGLPGEDARGPGMGLRIMSHRAAFVGATLSLISPGGDGTRVVCHLPRSET